MQNTYNKGYNRAGYSGSHGGNKPYGNYSQYKTASQYKNYHSSAWDNKKKSFGQLKAQRTGENLGYQTYGGFTEIPNAMVIPLVYAKHQTKFDWSPGYGNYTWAGNSIINIDKTAASSTTGMLTAQQVGKLDDMYKSYMVRGSRIYLNGATVAATEGVMDCTPVSIQLFPMGGVGGGATAQTFTADPGQADTALYAKRDTLYTGQFAQESGAQFFNFSKYASTEKLLRGVDREVLTGVLGNGGGGGGTDPSKMWFWQLVQYQPLTTGMDGNALGGYHTAIDVRIVFYVLVFNRLSISSA